MFSIPKLEYEVPRESVILTYNEVESPSITLGFTKVSSQDLKNKYKRE